MTSYNKSLHLLSRVIILVWVLFHCNFSIAQTTISGQINSYSAVTGFPGDCRNVITVDNPAGFIAGTQVLIIQMQGATINQSNDGSYGEIITYNGAGLYEKAVIQVVDENEITLTADLVNTYDLSGKVQLVTIPQYTDVVVGGLLTVLPWNGTTGGVLAFEASGTVTLNANISVDGVGFRGGQITNDPNNLKNDCNPIPLFYNGEYFYDEDSWRSAFKGEGIAEFINNKELGRGPQANGGGAGNDHNSGGGGGANYGAGGDGGNNNDPDDGIFSSTCKGYYPGLGGKFARSNNRVFLGGGGGGGHSNNNRGTAGGNGGGIIYIKANTLSGNGRTISANGISAEEGTGDGGGGGGAGGTILLNINPSNPIINSINIQVQGGNGANISNSGQNRCFGPGGGGGGGLVASTVDLSDIVSGITGVALAGGNPGATINSSASCNNSTNGATTGGEGIVLNTFVMPMGTIITGDLCKPVPTPVEFIQFTAKLENTGVKLEWITASETNNDYFAVERSDNNQIFSQITQVAGSGNSNNIKKYQAVDWNPMYGISYYKIRQVDYDGKVSYSKVVAVENKRDQFTFTVFPNPVQIKESFNLKIYMPQEETVQIQLVDLIGKLIFSIDKHVYTGQNMIELNALTITSGVYFIYVKTSKGYKVQKIKAVK